MEPINTDMVTYYKKRAQEYDKVYHIPDEQADLQAATAIFQPLFANKKVIEIACGTGYWTSVIAQTAADIYATDINEEMIVIAQQRCQMANVRFEAADMFAIAPLTKYDALFGGFIWSHILLQNLDTFLLKVQFLLKKGAVVAFIDSLLTGEVHDKRKILTTDAQGNTYQKRILDDGNVYQVLKNFPDKELLTKKMATIAEEIQVTYLQHYWIVTGKVK